MTLKANGLMVLAGHGIKGQQIQLIAPFTPMLNESHIFWKTGDDSSFFHRRHGLIFHTTEKKITPPRSTIRPLAHGLLFVAVAITVFN